MLGMAAAPVCVCLVYIFIRDKYEKEPIKLLCTGLLFGIIITVPIIHTQNFLVRFTPYSLEGEKIFHSYVVAAAVEELFKFLVLCALMWRHRELDEHFDGIVYAVFVSLGFAGVENVMYVTNPSIGGVWTAASRAFFSVPGHMFFGVCMGYYFSLAKFEKKRACIFKAFFVTFLMHGTYDYVLLSKSRYMFVPFGILVVYMWVQGFYKMRKHLQKSPFK
ncbi:protease PrsW [Clostridia bacterium]|nr:protease PrsW [Clostridia bacterium]